jgi:hypothetical protein
MTRTARLLTLAASLTLLLAMISTATAGPPDGAFCDKHENHPRCTSEVLPPSGLSCADYEKIAPEDAEEALVWDVSLSESMSVIFPRSDGSSVCIDVSNSEPGRFVFDVENADGAKRNSVLYALIKDSHPGDHCGSALNLNLRSGEFDGTITDVPAAHLNACGTEYSEAEVAPNTEGEWLVVNPTTEQDGTPDPLALMLGISGKPGVTADVTIRYIVDVPDIDE